jgi:DNA-directed RNA polymerase subunit N (RpoN/RPB10)
MPEVRLNPGCGAFNSNPTWTELLQRYSSGSRAMPTAVAKGSVLEDGAAINDAVGMKRRCCKRRTSTGTTAKHTGISVSACANPQLSSLGSQSNRRGSESAVCRSVPRE